MLAEKLAELAQEANISALEIEVSNGKVLALTLPNKEKFVLLARAGTEQCRYAALYDPATGRITPNSVPNFLHIGGWKKGARVSRDETAEMRQEINHKLVAARAATQLISGGEEGEELPQLVEKFLTEGLSVRGEENPSIEDMATLGVRYAVARALCELGYEVYASEPKTFFGRFINSNYAVVVAGEWDDASEELAITANISTSQAVAMKKAKVKLTRRIHKR